MTVSTTDSYTLQVADGTLDTFSFSFKCTDSADLRVIVDDAVTADDTVVFTTSLNADQNANPGGTITLGVVPAAASQVYIASDIAPTQETDLANATTFRAEIIEAWMDRMTMVIQQLKADVARTLKTGETQSGGEISEIITTGSVVITLYMQGLLSTVSTAAEFRTAIDALQDADSAVTTAHLADLSVTEAKIADSAVTIGKIADGILANSTAGRLKMANGFLAASAAGRAKMEDGYVTEAKIDPAFLAALPTIQTYTTATDTTEAPAGDFLIAANNDESASFLHGFGAIPTMIIMQLVCLDATGSNYTVGDVVDVVSSGSANDRYACDYDATRIVLKTLTAINSDAAHPNKIRIVNKGVGNLVWVDKSYWAMRAVAYKW